MRAATLRPAASPRVPVWGLHLLAFAAIWTTLLSSLVAAVDPSVAGVMPTHTHASLSGLVARHTHHAPGARGSAACTVEPADGHTAASVACGVDSTGSLEAIVVSLGSVGAVAAAGLLTTVIEPPTRFVGIATTLATPPPRF
jgi:hypothetical protein